MTDHISSWPRNDASVKQSIDALFESGEWGKYTGQALERLIDQLQQYFVREHAFLCSSGTIAVELALRAVNVRPGDEVILAAYDFPGNFRAIESIGATPVLVDLQPSSWRINVDQIAQAVTEKTSAIIASHLHGELLPMDVIASLASEKQIALVEDACQCPGARIAGKRAGQWGQVSVISFGGSKLLSCGRGGTVLCDAPEYRQRMQINSDRGNLAYPLSQLQAAALLPQLEILDQRNKIRLANATKILNHLREYQWLDPLDLPTNVDDIPAFYKLPMLLTTADDSPWQREQVIAALKAEHIPVDAGFLGFTKRSSRRCRKTSDCAYAQQAAAQTILLHHPVLLENDAVIERLLFGFEKVNRAILETS